MGTTTGIWLLCLGILAITYETDASIAAMSIDLGSQFIKVGLVKPGVPMEIVLNKESRRKTPNLLSIRNSERIFGDAALAVNVRHPTSVYGNILDLLAKNIDHPSVKLFKDRYPHLEVFKHVNDSSVVIPFGDKNYSVETVLAMILSNAREFTEAYAEQKVKDVVITVPVFFTQAERLAVEKAAQIARLNLLQLINDGTAAALSHGVFRRKEITEKAQKLLVYDMGSAKTTATLVEYKLVKEKYGKEPKMTVLGVGYDRTLGGMEMTLRLQRLLVEKFRTNYKTEKDITTNNRAMAKMFKESERVKQVLSANVDHYAQIESVHEDKDMRVKVTREEFNALIADLEPRMGLPVKQALAMAETTIDQVDQIVLMGAGTRVPKVQETLQNAVGGKELGRFLNTDEAAAMGALFQAAHLSKGFKVKTFNVDGIVIFPVQVNFISKQKQENGDVLDKAITRQIFQYRTAYPTSKKSISFTSYTDDFTFELNYGELKHFSEQQINEFGSLTSHLTSVSVTGLAKALEEKLTEETEFKGVKVGFKMDGSGIVRSGHAEAVIQKKSQGVVESITNTISGFFSSKTEEGEPSDSEEKKDGADESETDAAAPTEDSKQSEGSDVPATETEEKKKPEDKKIDDVKASNDEEKKDEADKKEPSGEKNSTEDASKAKKPEVPQVVKVSLKLSEEYKTARLPNKDEMEDAKTILEAFERVEKLAAERMAAENELEAYAFEASLLGEDAEFVQYSTEEERTKISEEVTKVRAWLEDDTSPATKTGEFKENYRLIKDLVYPIKKRISESKALPPLIVSLESMINSSRVMVGMGGDDEKSLFNKNDTVAFGKKLDKLETWLNGKKDLQAKRKENDDPAVYASEVDGKIKALDRELKSFMKKMKSERTVNMKKDKKVKKEETVKEGTQPESADNKAETKAEDTATEKDAEVPSETEVPKEAGEQTADSKVEL